MSDHDDLLDAMMNAKQAVDLDLLRAQQAQHIQAAQMRQQRAMNMAQNQYNPGWNDPRAMMGAQNAIAGSGHAVITSEELIDNVRGCIVAVKDLRTKVEKAEHKVEVLSGFYHWVTEVHPELAAQYKAMRDLYEAANAQPAQPREEMGS